MTVVKTYGSGANITRQKPRRWSHQQELDTLKGTKIDIFLVGGLMIEGATLVDADQFAIKIAASDRKSTLTYYKHAIAAYGVALAKDAG